MMCSEEDLFFNEKNIDRERIVINKNSSLLNDCFCSICWCLLWKPCSCSSCQNLFCNECIQTWLNISSSTCPLCRLSYNEKPPPLSIHSILTHISIRCRNTSLGCTEILLYDLLEQHESIDCHFRTKKCRLCEQIILIKDIDQHKNICKPIVIQCNVCQCFIKIDLLKYHQDQCSIQNEDFIESFTFSNQTILSPISVVNFTDIELFNQAREKNYFYRFYAMFQLMLVNLKIIHLILFNLLVWNLGNLIVLNYFKIWNQKSIYLSFIVLILFNYIFYFVLNLIDDIFIILFIIFSLIISSSIDSTIEINQFQMNFNQNELLLFSILIFFLFQIPLWFIRLYFDYIPIHIGAICLSLMSMIWFLFDQ